MPRSRTKDGLTDKQRKLAKEYLIDLKPSQAAIRAGYSARTVHQTAWEYLAKPCVQKEIARLQDIEAKKAGITAEMVIAEMKKIGFANIQDFIESGNNIKDISELPRELTAAVESIQTDVRHDGGKSEGYTEKVKFKLHSKLGALNSLAEILKIKDVAGRTDIKILQIGGLKQIG